MTVKDQIFFVPFKDTNISAYMLSLGSTLYLKFNELSGNIINYGSDGNTGTVTACTQGQVGQLGVNEAYLYNGTTSLITFLNASLPNTVALTEQRWCFLVNASSLGEGNAGRFISWNPSSSHRISFVSSNRMSMIVDTNGIDAQNITNNNHVDFLNLWSLVFVDYDDNNVLGLGRKIRIFRATSTLTVQLLTLATDTAGTGIVTPPTGNLTVGNYSTATATFAGLFDFAFCSSGLWTLNSPTDFSLMNQIRNLVFGS